MATLVLFVLLSLCITAHAQVSEGVLAARESAVSLLVPDFTGELKQVCSGAVVRLPQGPMVLSAGHCLTGNASVYVRDAKARLYPADVEAAADYRDAASLQDYAMLSSVAQWLLPSLEPDPAFPELGAEVWAWSAPHDIHSLLLVRGMYIGDYHSAAGSELDGLRVIELNSEHGSSGSLLLSAEGKAVAIVSVHFGIRTKFVGTMVTPLPVAVLGEGP